jgi:hypothetical protein
LIVAVDGIKNVIMKSKVERFGITVIVGLFILIVLVAIPDRDQGTDYGAVYPSQQSEYEYPSYENRANPTYGYTNTKSNSSTDRTEILKTKVKGYRESTYWGTEHAIDERVRNMNSSEFKRYVKEEVVQNDADVYWGAEY